MRGVAVKEGGLIPHWWAIAYRDFDADVKIAYPIPLHWAVRWSRDIRYWFMRVGRPGYRERVERAVYLKGREDSANAYHSYIRYLVDNNRDEWIRGYEAGCRQPQ